MTHLPTALQALEQEMRTYAGLLTESGTPHGQWARQVVRWADQLAALRAQPVASRSKLKRQAVLRGEEMPTFMAGRRCPKCDFQLEADVVNHPISEAGILGPETAIPPAGDAELVRELKAEADRIENGSSATYVERMRITGLLHRAAARLSQGGTKGASK